MGPPRFELGSRRPERRRITRLPHGPMISGKFFNYRFVREKHSPTAVSLYPKGVQSFFRGFSLLYEFFILFPLMGNDRTTRKASDGKHEITCMKSVFSFLLLFHLAFSAPFSLHRLLGEFCRILRMLSSARGHR